MKRGDSRRRVGVADLLIDYVQRNEERVVEKSSHMRGCPEVEAGSAVEQSQSLIERLHDLIAVLSGCCGPLLRGCSLIAYPGLLGSEHLTIDVAVVMGVQQLLLLALKLLKAPGVSLGLLARVLGESTRVALYLAPNRILLVRG